MAADVLLYDTDIVPVGDDQRQHVELTRDVAIRFNHRFGDTFVVPKAVVAPEGARIMDLQRPDAKMSKSDDSPQGTLGILDPPSSLAKRIKSAVTDSDGAVRFDPAAKPGVSNLLSDPRGRHRPTIAAVEAEHADGGYGALKTAVADAVVELVTPIQARYAELAADPAEVDRILAAGAARVEVIARRVLGRARTAAGLLPRGDLMPDDLDGDEAEQPPAESVEHRGRRYIRHSPGLEFDRVAFFSDAVFAIAMTLLVVGVGIPHGSASGLEKALSGKRPEITAFFISFVVIGNYWLSHHRFFSHLQAASPRLMLWNLVYLAAIAFTPYPTALTGIYEDQPISVVMFAITLGVASGLEAVMFYVAHLDHLFERELPLDVVRWSIVAAMIPVAVFFLSIPIAFVDTGLALLSWILIFPLETIVDRKLKPDDADELL